MTVNADRIKRETILHRVYHSSEMESESISIRFANRLNNRKSAGTIVLFSVLLVFFSFGIKNSYCLWQFSKWQLFLFNLYRIASAASVVHSS